MSQVVVKEENAEQTTSISNVVIQTSSDLHGTDIKVEETIDSPSVRSEYHHQAEINNIVIKSEPIEYEESAVCNNHLEDAPIVLPIDLESKEDLRCKLEAITDVQNICNVLVMKNTGTFPDGENPSNSSPTNSSMSSGDKMLKPNFSAAKSPMTSYQLKIGSLRRFANKKDNGMNKAVNFNCDKCSYATHYLLHLKNHYKSEHLSDLYPCDGCSFLFLSLKSLRCHNWNCHKTSKMYRCSKCDFSTEVYSSLSNHRYMKHSVKKYKCTVAGCDLRFNCKSRLRGHIIQGHRNLQSNIGAHMCRVCHREFSSLTYLILHQRKHTGFRPYACQDCDFKSSHKSSLRDHIIRKHSPSNPSLGPCDKSESPNQLSVDPSHILDSVANIKCQLCSFKSMSWKNLVQHHKTFHKNAETPKKPFQCSKCSSRFVRKDSLEKHINNSSCTKILAKTSKSELKNLPELSSQSSENVPVKAAAELKTIEPKKSSKSNLSSDKVLHECQACNEQFPTLKVLKRHLKYCVFL